MAKGVGLKTEVSYRQGKEVDVEGPGGSDAVQNFNYDLVEMFMGGGWFFRLCCAGEH